MSRINLFGEIGFDIESAEVAAWLDELPPGEPVTAVLNSAGGSLQEGIAIYSLLQSRRGPVEIEIAGWALS